MRFQPRLHPAPRVALTSVAILVLSIIGPAPVVQARDAVVETASTPIQISTTGSSSTCLVRPIGEIGCVGDDGPGPAPQGPFVAVSAAGVYACGLRAGGTVSCWSSSWAPIGEFVPSGTFTDVATGEAFDCGIQTNDSLACWRRDGAAVPAPPPGSYVDIAVGRGHACAISTSGEITCWGDGTAGQTAAPEEAAIAVAAGGDASCAILTGGSITCWGDAGELGGVPVGDFVALDVEPTHGCAIASDGTITCWGQDTAGQSSPPAGTYRSISVAFGLSCAIRTDETPVCWGSSQGGANRVTPTGWVATGDEAVGSRIVTWGAYPAFAPVVSKDVRYERVAWNALTFDDFVSWRSATTTHSARLTGSAGHTYCISARGRDADGMVGPWRGWEGREDNFCMANPVDDRTVVRTASWQAGTGSQFYRDTFLRTYTQGAKVKLRGIYANGIGLVVTTCPTCGSVRLYWNGDYKASLNLYSAQRKDQVVRRFSVLSWNLVQTGTLTVKVVSSGKKVVIDGVLVARGKFRA